ncbi:CAP domain-containing protein [Kingella negevensis]|uniref:CAP domain-containing protein n=2 Tax=Kingella negevensis TaxID=1522312 RepID=UPI00254BC92D|nr:CAP domain-containing protein [Kingella negevensis]MDK4687980.1 CAP domain-containing protein [Kingella negevensis]
MERRRLTDIFSNNNYLIFLKQTCNYQKFCRRAADAPFLLCTEKQPENQPNPKNTPMSTRKKQRQQQNRNALATQRILMFWLPLAAVIFGLVYWTQSRYDSKRETLAGFDRLNHWRRQAGVTEFTPSEILAQSAQNHALYLTKNADGHEENHPSNPHFTGKEPQERATKVGYPAPMVENLTQSNLPRSGKASVDSLMTAIYHRLALLNPDHDEAGAAWENDGDNAFVVNQGSSYDREICSQETTGQKRYVLTTQCNGKKREIPMDEPPPSEHIAVKYPIGSGIDPSYDGKEVPSPVPDLGKTGNPISIAFYGETSPIRVESYKLTSPKGEVSNTRMLDASNDPNRLLTETQFVLFPVKPLEYNTEYTVEFTYLQDNQRKTETWTFRTRRKRGLFDF